MKRRELATMLVVCAVALMTMGCRSRHHDAVDGTKKFAAALTESQPATMNVAAPLPATNPAPTPVVVPSTSLTGIYTCFFCPGATVGSRVAIVTQSGNFVQITSGKTRTSCVNVSGQLVCDVKGAQARKSWRANLVPNSRGELRGEYVSPTGSHPFILLPKRA
jgi:hypothetical protein